MLITNISAFFLNRESNNNLDKCVTCLRTHRKDKSKSRTHKYGYITVKVMVSMLEVSLDFICATIFVMLPINKSFTSIHCLVHVDLYSI